MLIRSLDEARVQTNVGSNVNTAKEKYNGSQDGKIGQRNYSIKPSLNSKQSVGNNKRARSEGEETAGLSAIIANSPSGVETTMRTASTNRHRTQQHRKRHLRILVRSSVQIERSERALMRKMATEKARRRRQSREKAKQSSKSGTTSDDMPGLKGKRASSPYVSVDASVENINAMTRGVLGSSMRPRTVFGSTPRKNWRGEDIRLQPALGFVLLPNH